MGTAEAPSCSLPPNRPACPLRAPLSVSRVVCDVRTRDLSQLVPFQLEQSPCSQDKHNPRPEKLELPVSGSKPTAGASVVACPLCRVGGVPEAQSPSPACPPLPLPSLCRAGQSEERSWHRLACSWVQALSRAAVEELGSLEQGKLSL